jgi:hypothetical protein
MREVIASRLVCTFAALLPLGGLHAQASSPKDISDYLSRCQVLAKYSQGNLSLVAVQANPAPGKTQTIATMDELMPTGQLVIKETGSEGTVNTLLLQNKSQQPVFIMAGEILAGSKQDRILQQDVLLPPKSKPIPVAAFCVEHGRWTQTSAQFYSEKVSAPLSVRNKAKVDQSQMSVWSEVSKNNGKLQARATSGTLSATYKTGQFMKSRAKYLEALKDLPSKQPKANGVVVLVNGRVMGADLFADQKIFDRLWPKLLDSYIAEAARREGETLPAVINSPEELLKIASTSPVELKNSPGIGRQIDMNAKQLKGSGISLNVPVHLDLFPVGPNEHPESVPSQQNILLP